MYAVVNTGGKQAKVATGDIIAVERLGAEVGETVTLPVIFIADGERVLATPAELEGAGVSAEVLEHFKGEKQIVFKFKKRKGYKRTLGHRQSLTSVRILDIATSGASVPKAKSESKAEAPRAPKSKPVASAAPVADAENAAPASAGEAALCEAVKSDGTRCQNKAKEGSKYCGVHAKKLEG